MIQNGSQPLPTAKKTSPRKGFKYATISSSLKGSASEQARVRFGSTWSPSMETEVSALITTISSLATALTRRLQKAGLSVTALQSMQLSKPSATRLHILQRVWPVESNQTEKIAHLRGSLYALVLGHARLTAWQNGSKRRKGHDSSLIPETSLPCSDATVNSTLSDPTFDNNSVNSLEWRRLLPSE